MSSNMTIPVTWAKLIHVLNRDMRVSVSYPSAFDKNDEVPIEIEGMSLLDLVIQAAIKSNLKVTVSRGRIELDYDNS